MATSKRLNATITIGGTVTGALKTAISGATKSLEAMGKTIRDLDRSQRLLGKSIQEFGRAGKDVDGMRTRYASLTEQLERTRRAQQRLIQAQNIATKVGGAIKGTAIAAGVGAATATIMTKPLVGAAIARENAVNVIRNSGVSKDEADAMIKAAQDSKQFGVSVTKATETLSELRTALGDTHHAIDALPTALKVISGLQMYDRLHHTDMASGDAAYNITKIAEERGGSTDPEAMRRKYDYAFKALTGSNGKVTIADQLAAVRAGKGAVQAMDDRAFFGDTFLQQAMGADRYGTSSSTWVNAWIGGHQTHGAFDHMMQQGLLNKDGVKFDKNGRVKTVSPNALVDAETFLKDPQTWVDKHLIPLAKKQGVALDDPAALLKFANAIASNPNVANMIVSRMRFDASIWKDRRNVEMAHGIEASDRANQESTAGKIENARARIDDAETRMGNVILPPLATALERVAGALEAVNKFADESPATFKAVTWGIVGLTTTFTAFAAVGLTTKLAVAGLEGTMALLSGTLGATSGAAATATGKITGLVGSILGKAGLVFALSSVALEVAKILGLPDTDVNKGRDDVKNGRWLAASAHLPAGEFISTAWNHMFGGDDKPKKPELQVPKANLPPLPELGLSMRSAQPVNDNRQYIFQVTQQPGQDSAAFARELQRLMRQQDEVKRRGTMYDAAGAH